MTIFVVLLTLIFFSNLLGLRIKHRGMRPNTAAEISACNQRLAFTADGRQVAYCCYGSEKSSVPVVINMHGSGLEANFERTTYHNICSTLDCRGIAISLPGCGFTDEKPGRQVKDWPAEDLEAVLNAENIDNFHITGHSQGTAHAMAAAHYFSQRCIGLGLNAPLLPTQLCQDLGLNKAIGTGSTPSSQRLNKVYMGWYFSLFWLAFQLLPSWIVTIPILKGLPEIKKDQHLLKRFTDSVHQSTIRGCSGAAWESAQDTCFDWGFNIKAIEHNNVVIWHADDDNTIPSEQGAWLANQFGAQLKHHAEGFGHLTYCQGQYQKPHQSLIYALLNTDLS